MTKNKRKKRILRALKIDEISMVDNPAQEGARISLLKRKLPDQEPDPNQLSKAVVLTTTSRGHSHTIMTDGRTIGHTSYDGSGPDDFGHSHPWIMGEDGTLTIGSAMGHSHAVREMAAKNSDPSSESADEGVSPTTDETTKMTDTSEMEKSLQAAEARANRAESIVSLRKAHREHFDSLAQADQDAFLDLDESAREAAVTKMAEADPVVYTSLDGVELRKSADPVLVAAVKSADEAKTALARQEKIAKRAATEKRASELFSHLGGDEVAKADLLEAIESIGDESARAAALEVVKSHDAGVGAAFNRFGTTDSGEGQSSDADELVKRAREYAKEHKVPLSKAYAELARTEEGSQMYSSYRADVLGGRN
jgi:hypothetical protein